MMEFTGEFTCDGTPEDLWPYFTDPDILQDAAPGCEEMRLVSPSRLTATLSVGVGSVRPTFEVDALVVECDRPDRLEIRASGRASRNTFEVSAWQELLDNGDGTTTVTWNATAEVSGLIASMGERALGSVAKKLVNEFFGNLEAHVNEGTPARSQFEAVDAEELAATGVGPDTTESGVSESSPVGPTGTEGGGPGGVTTFLVGVDRRVLALVAGTLALAGTVLWRRSRSHGSDSTGSGGVLRYVALGAVLGVGGKHLWDTYRGPEVTSAGSPDEPTGRREATATTGTAEQEGEPVEAQETGGYFDENPLDRLESR